MSNGSNKVSWCVKFWDFGEWDELSNTRSSRKETAIETARRLNKETTHKVRIGSFEGHRFRVRKVNNG